MPSGAKRRKAAKKKKENETHNGNSSNNNPQGDEKGSDGGEAGFNSQASEGRRSAEPSDVESVREVGLESDGDVRIERDSKESVRSKKKSGNGKDKSSSSSSSSSSEDESRRKKEKADAPVSEEKPPSNLVESVDSLLVEVTHTTKDAAVEKSTSMDSETIAPVEYNEPLVDDVSEETVPLTVSTPPFEYPVISDTVAETSLESTAEKLLPSEATVTVTDSISKKIESTESPGVSENDKASPSVVESEDKENETKVLPSSDVSPAHISNDVSSIKQSESPEYSEREPLVAPAPRVVEKTSWCDCCGILDVITGNRR